MNDITQLNEAFPALQRGQIADLLTKMKELKMLKEEPVLLSPLVLVMALKDYVREFPGGHVVIGENDAMAIVRIVQEKAVLVKKP